jgi:ubiquinone/menaquinone biosynthesis C-methylase UbiE
MSFEALKARQSEAWGSAPWEPMAARLAAVHDHLVARLPPVRGERWLDVGTGTGAVALRAARAGARVTGVDLSPAMIDTARQLAGEQGAGIRYEVGDAESLPYEDASFDVVASALGVFLAPDHAAAGRELARLCRPGGRLGMVAWRADPEAERMHAPFWPAGEPGAGDRRDWGREQYVTELLGQEFELEFEEGELQQTAKSGEEMWRHFTSYDGAAKAQVNSLDRRRAEEYRRAYVAHHERHRANGRISMPRRYLITLGRRRGGSHS